MPVLAKDLRAAVLQAAVQGNLTEQLFDDGTAEDLYQQIQVEKMTLVKNGVIKKEKLLPDVTKDEELFEIPDNWKWCRLSNILYKLTDGTHSTPKYTETGIPFLSVKDMSDGCLSFDNCKHISKEEHRELYKRCNPELGDILLTKVGTTGVPVINDSANEFSLFVSVALLKFSQDLIYNKFFLYLLQSPLVQSQAEENTRGVGNKNWVIRDIANTMIVLPPLAEQHRIVTRVEELMVLIDEYEKIEKQLEELKEKFPGDMKAALLQAAIQGKLTQQLPEDGDASDLLIEIKAEKEQLIKDKKIKKEKPLAPIEDDDIPFDIPDNWCWVRLGDIVSVYGGKRIPAGKTLSKTPTAHKYIRVSDMHNGTVMLDDIRYVPEDIYEKISRYTISSEDVYITVAGTIGRVGTIPSELDGANLTENADKLILYCNLSKHWLKVTLNSGFIQTSIANCVTQMAQPKLAIERIQKLLIPLPPLTEQQRIVEILDKLLPMCDELTE